MVSPWRSCPRSAEILPSRSYLALEGVKGRGGWDLKLGVFRSELRAVLQFGIGFISPLVGHLVISRELLEEIEVREWILLHI